MIYADGLSLYLQDLTDKNRRRDLTTFAENFFEAIEKRFTTARLFKPLAFSDFVYEPSSPEKEIAARGKKIIVLTDVRDSNSNLGKMIDRFTQPFTEEIEIIDLNDIDIRGGCLGCMRCGYDYTCVQKDGFTDFYNSRVMTADIIVFAGEVRGPYLSSKWKEFYDRAFFWNHTPSLVGKQLLKKIAEEGLSRVSDPPEKAALLFKGPDPPHPICRVFRRKSPAPGSAAPSFPGQETFQHLFHQLVPFFFNSARVVLPFGVIFRRVTRSSLGSDFGR